MRFDLFYELSVPPFLGRSESEVFRDTLAEIALGEELGFSTAWVVEHHFMPEYSHCSAPEMFLAAASQLTHRIRLGHAIVPLPYNHPVRVAERIATLDVLSNGRTEFGFGRGFSPAEYAIFGVDTADGRSYTEESLEIVRRSFRGGRTSFTGRHFRVDEIEILPKPVQRPHPPIWTAAVSPDSFELAARMGIGVLIGPFKPWFMVKEDIRRYREAWLEHHGAFSDTAGLNSRAAMTVGILCAEDGKSARRLAKLPFEWFYGHLLGQTRPILEDLYAGFEYYRKFGRFTGLLNKAVNLRVLDTLGMTVVGDPAHCVKRLHGLADAGVDHVLLAFGAGAMPSQTVRDSMRLFAEQVMPEFER